MDFDPREDRVGPIKLARTDSFPLKMQISNNASLMSSLVRSNSIASDCRLGCSSTTASSEGVALLGNESNYLAEARLVKTASDSMLSYPGGFNATARMAMAYHQQQQGVSFKSSGLPLAMTGAAGAVYGGGNGGGAVQAHEVIAGELRESAAVQVFTASQLRELQLHALIFKHMVCGVNVPPELVLLVRTSMAAIAGMTTAGPHLGSFGWGNYHLGYGNSVDPEPGRCRRTDGKKWRCARDVVPDQKYCERHMHRGRHRARKPPDNSGAPSPSSSAVTIASSIARSASAGLAPAGLTTTVNSSGLRPAPAAGITKGLPNTSSFSGGSLSIGSSVHSSHAQQQQQQQQLALQKDFGYFSSDLSCQEQTLFSDARGLSQETPALSGISVISSAVNNPLGGMHSKAQRHSFLGGGFEGGIAAGREPEGQPLRHFFDDWPRGRDPSSLTWSDMDGEHEQRSANRSASTTQLSISIPMEAGASSGFGSNGSSPRGKMALSPLKLSMSRGAGEDDPLGVDAFTQMGLGVGLGVNEAERQRLQLQSSWVPITWESATSVGGPLAEVLQSSSNTPRAYGGSSSNNNNTTSMNCKPRPPGLNLMADAWESSPARSSPPMASSPTGVLQIVSDAGTSSNPHSVK